MSRPKKLVAGRRDHYSLPSYDETNATHRSLCLRLIFLGNIESKVSGQWRIRIAQHVPHFQAWFLKTFGFPPSITKAHGFQNRVYTRRLVSQHATKFIRGAVQAGWRFGQFQWHIPPRIIKQYPLEVLRHWMGMRARLFTFVTRRMNTARTATTIKHVSVHQAGVLQISQLLKHFQIPHLVHARHQKRRLQDQQISKKDKRFWELTIYGMDEAFRLGELCGWDREEYLKPYRWQVMRKLLQQTLDLHKAKRYAGARWV